MNDTIRFDDEFYPVPPTAVDADPALTIRELLFRVSRLEQSLDEDRVQAAADVGELLLDLISLSDDVTHIVERWGVTTNAEGASIIRSVVALGKNVVAALRHHDVKAISTLGEPVNPKTSDVVATEPRANVPNGIVLREERVGYAWSHGLLRRAQVVVSGPDADERAGDDVVTGADDE